MSRRSFPRHPSALAVVNIRDGPFELAILHKSNFCRRVCRGGFSAWAPAGFFPGWAMRGSEGRKPPSRVQGQLPGGGLGATPQKRTTFSQNDAYTSSTGFFYTTFAAKNTFRHFQRGEGASAPLCPCLRVPMVLSNLREYH